MNIKILQSFIKHYKSCNKEPTWEELRSFVNCIRKHQAKKLN